MRAPLSTRTLWTIAAAFAIGMIAGMVAGAAYRTFDPAGVESVVVPVDIHVPREPPPQRLSRVIVDGVDITAAPGEPITIDRWYEGPARTNDVAGSSTSAGLRAASGDAAGDFDASAGSPTAPSLWGSPLSFTLPGGSKLGFEFTPKAGLFGFAGLGALFLIGAAALWYFTRNIVLAACVGGIGAALVSIGLAPELWVWGGLAIGALGIAWLAIHVTRARSASKTRREATLYDEAAQHFRRQLTPDQWTAAIASAPAELVATIKEFES